MTTDIAGLRAYQVDRPTVADLHTRILGADDPHLWTRLCSSARLAPDTDDPDALPLLIAAALEITTGQVRVTVASLNVRLRMHTVLAGAAADVRC